MPWTIFCEVKDPHTYDRASIPVAEYATQNEARWWAVELMKRNAININQGEPEEYLLPTSSIMAIRIKET